MGVGGLKDKVGRFDLGLFVGRERSTASRCFCLF